METKETTCGNKKSNNLEVFMGDNNSESEKICGNNNYCRSNNGISQHIKILLQLL